MLENLLARFSETHQILAYLIIFLGMFIEGEMILILSGILVKSGAIGFFNTLWISFIAVIFHDLLYWKIGQKLSRLNKKKYLFFDLEKGRPLFEKIQKRQGFYVFSSKFAWNLNRVVLVSLGYLGIPFKNLFRASVASAFLWALTFISLGFIFAEQTDLLKKDLKIGAVFITIFFIAVVAVEQILQKYFRNRNGINQQSTTND